MNQEAFENMVLSELRHLRVGQDKHTEQMTEVRESIAGVKVKVAIMASGAGTITGGLVTALLG